MSDGRAEGIGVNPISLRRTAAGFVLLLVLLLALLPASPAFTDSGRGVRPLPEGPWAQEGFDPQQSWGIFVGVRLFPEEEHLYEVPYAVDDAVDLAHLFALELRLVEPDRVRLLLSGRPNKASTRGHLRDLEQAGAEVGKATRNAIAEAVDRGIQRAGAQGLLLISFATHGFSDRGVHYLMPQDSQLRRVAATGYPSHLLFDAMARARPPRRILLLDACRPLMPGRPVHDPRTAVPRQLRDAIAKAKGEVILSAARLGGLAFDDAARGNGVFTRSILDGLRCSASRDARGFVTIETLTDYVGRSVTDWVTDHLGDDPGWPPGIESTLGGAVGGLPLAECSTTPPPLPGCAALELDLDRGTLGSLAPVASQATIVGAMPCEADIVAGAPGLGSVNFPDAGIRFAPGRKWIEVRAPFAGRIVLDGSPVSLLGQHRAAVLLLLGTPSGEDPDALLYDRPPWGCLQLKLSDRGTITRVVVHGDFCYAVPRR